MAEVIGTNSSGVGVSGTGSNYGVYGTSTGNFAGLCAKNGGSSTAPGIYAQTMSSAPGILAISGLASLVDVLFSTDLDAAAAKWGSQYPSNAGVFVGGVAVTGGLVIGSNPSTIPAVAGSLTAATASFRGTVKVSGAMTGTTCAFQGGSDTGVFGGNGAGSGRKPKSGCGVWGDSDHGYGLYGSSKTASGVYGASDSGLAGEFVGRVTVSGAVTGTTCAFEGGAHTGVFGANGSGSGKKPKSGCGVWGDSDHGHGLYGASKTASGIYGASETGLAGEFAGDVSVTGHVKAADVILSGGDCAEEFDATAELEPGTVAVFDDDGCLSACALVYDKRVAGVVSGAGDYLPGIVLDSRLSARRRAAIALVGKVFCRVDAILAPIEPGDLLTTSATPGHAMRAADQTRAFGSVIGKALASCKEGRGLIPMIVSLR
jgi:hypothetical protein